MQGPTFTEQPLSDQFQYIYFLSISVEIEMFLITALFFLLLNKSETFSSQYQAKKFAIVFLINFIILIWIVEFYYTLFCMCITYKPVYMPDLLIIKLLSHYNRFSVNSYPRFIIFLYTYLNIEFDIKRNAGKASNIKIM